jgi:hypothetical protein
MRHWAPSARQQVDEVQPAAAIMPNGSAGIGTLASRGSRSIRQEDPVEFACMLVGVLLQ